MTSSNDAPRTTAHNVTERDWDGNEELSHSHSILEVEQQQEPEEDSF